MLLLCYYLDTHYWCVVTWIHANVMLLPGYTLLLCCYLDTHLLCCYLDTCYCCQLLVMAASLSAVLKSLNLYLMSVTLAFNRGRSQLEALSECTVAIISNKMMENG